MKFCACIVCLLAMGLVSCERKGSPYNSGMSLVASDPEAAARQFEIAVASDDNAANAHYQLAILFEKSQDKAGLLVWHLREYLRLSENLSEEERDDVEDWIRRTEKKMAIAISRRLGEDITDETSLRLKLLEEHAARQKIWIQELTSENITLRQQLAEAQSKQ